MTTTAQQIEQARVDGIVDGIAMYAWWKDGVQYVGTRGTKLKDAVESVRQIAWEVERKRDV